MKKVNKYSEKILKEKRNVKASSKVLFVVPHLYGSMRVFCAALHFLPRSMDIGILVVGQDIPVSGKVDESIIMALRNELPAHIPVISLPHSRGLKRLKSLPHIMLEARKYNVLVAWPELNITYACALIGKILRKPTIGIVHTSLRKVFELGQRPRTFHEPFIKATYPMLYATVGVSHELSADLEATYHLNNVVSLPNAVDINAVIKLANESVPKECVSWFEKPSIVSIAAFSEQKDHITLINAFAKLQQSDLNCNLILLGDGPRRQEIEKLVIKLGVNSSVFFGGYQKNPYSFLKKASAFVLSTHYEGFGNVIVESLSLGIPTIATDCPSGPREILANRYGLLVKPGDPESLVQAMRQSIVNDELRQRLMKCSIDRARNYSMERYSERLYLLLEAASRRTPIDELRQMLSKTEQSAPTVLI